MRSLLIRALIFVVPVAIAVADSGTARAQEVIVTVAPPPAYIASAQPEYFEGRPVYYYNNYWHYRDRGCCGGTASGASARSASGASASTATASGIAATAIIAERDAATR